MARAKKATKSTGRKKVQVKRRKTEWERLDLGVGYADLDFGERIPLDQAIAKINAELKKEVLKPATKSGNAYRLRRPFGIVSIDKVLGGGPPAGGTTQIEGKDHSGKNALTWQAIKTLQYIFGEETRVLWCWLEGPVDKQHGRIIGAVCPSSDLELAMENQARIDDGWGPFTEEMIMDRRKQIGDFIVVDKGTAEKKLEVTADMVALNQFQLIVIDSLGAISAKPLLDTELGKDARRGAIALVQTMFQHRLWNALANPAEGCGESNFTTILALNQVRANQHMSSNPQIAKRQKKVIAADANAIKHGKLIDIELVSGAPIRRGSIKVGKMVNGEVIKGKAGCHEGPKFEIPYYFASGWDVTTDLVINLKKEGMIIDRKTKVDVVDHHGEVLIADAPHGQNLMDFRDILFDQDIYWKLYLACMRKIATRKEGVSCLHVLRPEL